MKKMMLLQFLLLLIMGSSLCLNNVDGTFEENPYGIKNLEQRKNEVRNLVKNRLEKGYSQYIWYKDENGKWVQRLSEEARFFENLYNPVYLPEDFNKDLRLLLQINQEIKEMNEKTEERKDSGVAACLFIENLDNMKRNDCFGFVWDKDSNKFKDGVRETPDCKKMQEAILRTF